MQKEIITEIVINAPKEKVWKVLTDFNNYPKWNKFIVSITGKAEPKATLINKLNLNGKIQTFKPTVVKVVENKLFEWVGKLPLGLFNGLHTFEIISLDGNQVKLVHKEKFSGLLSGLILKMIKEETQKGFIAMNKALKIQAEK